MYIHDPTHMIDWNLVHMEPKGEFQVEPLRNMVRREITLQKKAVTQVKVQWKNFSLEEGTWEYEGDLRKSHLTLFQ
jgi:hypothetical protein